ncbi:hypothetical protein L226DRAFT_534004 [Lentinus tigrinus ALCF2SS1-7]|uniref:Uncharacterized protein n=1 Tax=Lentinus tigrinus ALCF2SS1-6 TaxID=1328759 RepID=A0A5C2SDJ8_9APHY|nr:hypothetical protein L227DRAFT_652520 [Lentinus tigrinus ALCF2SS1-6]RPD75941.1 hypothetical protein L226DRAFT_534004 [Lentinus tigrinus ALCF2SS1-7]
MPKNSSTIVVRPMKRGAAAVASKTVLGTMCELNHHAPLAEIAPHLVCEDPKPWKQSSRSAPRLRRGVRRNAGRDDGRTWVSRRFVCGAAVDADWGSDLDLEDPADATDVWEGDGAVARRRVEVDILDIAKPAKVRGTAREYEMVQSVSRVITFGDDDRDQWVDVGGDVPVADAEWEAVEGGNEAKVPLQKSYAAALRV